MRTRSISATATQTDSAAIDSRLTVLESDVTALEDDSNVTALETRLTDVEATVDSQLLQTASTSDEGIAFNEPSTGHTFYKGSVTVTKTVSEIVSFATTDAARILKQQGEELSSGFPSTFPETMFTLPAAFRPLAQVQFTCDGYTSSDSNATRNRDAIVLIEPTGEVKFDGGASRLAYNSSNEDAHGIRQVRLSVQGVVVSFDNLGLVTQRLSVLELDTYERNIDGVTIETTTSSTTRLFDANSNWNNTSNNPLGNGVYQIYVFQRSSGADTTSAQNKVQHLQARFPLVIASSTTSDQNGPLQQLHGTVFTEMNKHNGAVQFFLEYPTTSAQNAWRVHMLFTAATTDGSGNKDNLNLTIKVKKEVW